MSVNVDICIDFQIDFDDPFGDFWADTSPKPARGLEIVVEDDVSTQVLNLDDDTGCASATVDVGQLGGKFWLTARSLAVVNGVEITSHEYSSDYDNPTDPAVIYANQNIGEARWLVSALSGPIDKRLPLGIRWQGLAVATWIFNRSTFHILQGPSASCTFDNSPYQPEPPPVRLYFNTFGSGCPGGGGNDLDGHVGAIHYDSACPNKSLIAHEIGHAIVGMRIGDLEDYSDLDAPQDSCAGDYRNSSNGAPSNPLPQSGRGTFTKEHMAESLREGWGEFVALWAWNRRTESDCVNRTRGYYSDFNLDGLVDNDFPSGSPYTDMDLDCSGSPYLGADPSPLASDGVNWLQDLIAWPDPQGCTEPAGFPYNRSTIFDTSRMLWELTSTHDIPPEELADLYVDMCPRDWAKNDMEWSAEPGARLEERILDAAALQGNNEAIILDMWGDHVAP